jgi:ubiquitin carboxyl-terminal hydrolase 36/42
VGRVAKENV